MLYFVAIPPMKMSYIRVSSARRVCPLRSEASLKPRPRRYNRLFERMQVVNNGGLGVLCGHSSYIGGKLNLSLVGPIFLLSSMVHISSAVSQLSSPSLIFHGTINVAAIAATRAEHAVVRYQYAHGFRPPPERTD